MKNVIMILVGCLISFSAFSQQNLYKWRLGIHGGLGTYYGDLSTGRILDPQTDVLRFWDNKKNLSYGLSLQGSMSDAWSFRLMSTIGSFQANDRATKWNGDPYTESINYERALNFRTSYYDVDGIFIYSFDNGSFFGEKSFFAPYIGIGVGYMNYKVKGDLYQEDGSRYYYWSDNTIRDIGESDPNAANAIIIEQDGNFETDLRSLETEGETYGNSTLTIPVAMGLKFRLNDRVNLNLETTLHYAFSDYLDDTSGEYPVLYNSLSQVYASNPSGITRKTRGAGNNLNDIYGSFNLSIGYNFGYKKQGFNAPIFFIGESDPGSPIIGESPIVIEKEEIITNNPEEIEVEVIVKSEVDPIQNATIVIENATINQLNVDTIIQGSNQTRIIRDTVYEQGTLIKEKVIIRTDTIREIIQENIIIDNRTGDITPIEYEDEYVFIPLEIEWDTLISLDPVTLQEDTVVYSYSGDVAVEEVPEEPVFTLETIEIIELEEIDPIFFHENIGYLKDDLSEEEIILSDVQESNFELIALRNEINELKIKDNKSQEDMDALYRKLDELNAEYERYERYNNSLAIQGNDDYNKPANIEIQKASNEMAKDIQDIRTEIIYLESPTSMSKADYERIKDENDKRIRALEKEMRKLRKDVRKSKRDNLPPRVNNPSRLNDKKEDKETVVAPIPQTVIVDNSDPSRDLAYQLQIQKLEKELSVLKSNNNQTNSIKDAEIALLKTKLADLDRKVNAVQTTGNTDSQTLTYITNLERKLDELNRKLTSTQNDLVNLSNRPSPTPSTTIITQPSTPRPAPQAQIISTISPAREAVNRLGKVNIYYGSGKSYIKTEFYNDLDRVIMLMKQYPEITANLTGFTDKSGNPDANFRLSKKRSDTVADYLTKRGISSSRITTDYFGDTQSSSNNDPYSRRVEINLLAY